MVGLIIFAAVDCSDMRQCRIKEESTCDSIGGERVVEAEDI